MRDSKIKCQNMLRLREKRLVDRLQEIYENSRYGSINEFLNACLKEVAFKEMKEDEIISRLDKMEDVLNAIYERMKRWKTILFYCVSITNQKINTNLVKKKKLQSENFELHSKL